jgi:hypothetical protein
MKYELFNRCEYNLSYLNYTPFSPKAINLLLLKTSAKIHGLCLYMKCGVCPVSPGNDVTKGGENNMGILPEGEQLRRAVKWISDQRVENPAISLSKLVGEACLKFDLPPKDAEFLSNFFAEKE